MTFYKSGTPCSAQKRFTSVAAAALILLLASLISKAWATVGVLPSAGVKVTSPCRKRQDSLVPPFFLSPAKP